MRPIIPPLATLLACASAFAAIPTPRDWVPARWPSADVKSLELVAATPINCLLFEQAQWSEPIAREAARRGIATLAVLHPGGNAMETARKALDLGFTGVMLEGDFDPAMPDRLRAMVTDSKAAFVEIGPRASMRLDGNDPIIGTTQGVWPGILAQDAGAAKAAPSGTPWIDTNTGFLRYVRAATGAVMWMANAPPPKTVITPERYLQAIGDAGMTGARWVIALDSDFSHRLLAGDEKARADWQRIVTAVKYFEERKEWRSLRIAGKLALVQDADSGALLSGGILDMIAVKHTPVRPVPNRRMSDGSMEGAKMAVNVDPISLTADQKNVLKRFTRAGGTLLSGPPGWKMPAATKDQITLGKDDLEKLDQIWKELNSMTGRQNMGARLFNVSSMLSNLMETPDGKLTVLHLVNYADYPAEAVTIHLLGKFKSARLVTPEGVDKPLEMAEAEDGTGVEIEKMFTVASIVLEKL